MKGVFNIMKTNKITKLMIAFLAVLTVFSLTATAFAQTGTDTTGENTETQAEASAQTASAHEKHGHKDGKNRPSHTKKYNDDRFEDWFEDRIDARKHDVDFSQLPEDPTDEEMLDFFKQNFLGEAPEKKSDAKQERPVKKDRKADRFEDWFEDRIDDRGPTTADTASTSVCWEKTRPTKRSWNSSETILWAANPIKAANPPANRKTPRSLPTSRTLNRHRNPNRLPKASNRLLRNNRQKKA